LRTEIFEKNKFVEGRILSKKIICEDIAIFDILLEKQLNARPGQFIMLWIPGFGERPFSPTKTGKIMQLAVKKRGVFTKKLFGLEKRAYVGVRGPYGKPFKTKNVKSACIIAAGIGIAALVRLAEELAFLGADVDLIYSAKKFKQMVFLQRLNRVCKVRKIQEKKCEKTLSTLKDLAKTKNYDYVYCCGPEPFMAVVSKECKSLGLKAQFSLEKRIKCALGICGCCAVGTKLLCKDGPVFSGKIAEKFLSEGIYEKES